MSKKQRIREIDEMLNRYLVEDDRALDESHQPGIMPWLDEKRDQWGVTHLEDATEEQVAEAHAHVKRFTGY